MFLSKVSNLNIPVDGGKYQAKVIKRVLKPLSENKSNYVQVRLYLPPDFTESKRYPLVINVYGGPNSQQVWRRNLIQSVVFFTQLVYIQLTQSPLAFLLYCSEEGRFCGVIPVPQVSMRL